MKGINKIVDSSNVELKYVNPKGENVAANNLNPMNFCILKSVKIVLKNEPHVLFCQDNVLVTYRRRLLVLFLSLI